MAALIFAEHADGQLAPSVAHVVTAALQCDAEVHLLLCGSGAEAAAAGAASLQGVGRVLLLPSPDLDPGLPELLAPPMHEMARRYTHVLFAATSLGKSLAPRLAGLLGVSQASDILRVLASDTFECPMYAGSVIATLRLPDAIKILTVRTTAFGAAPAGVEATVERLPDAAGPVSGVSRLVDRRLRRSDRPELPTAKVIVSGGRGLGSRERFDSVLVPLADRLGAGIGASRAAVDEGYASNDQQVGQTGKIVAPELYIACGISGAIQHLAGMKDSRVIVAINRDPEAPIFSVADVGLVADLFEAVPELVRALESDG